MLRKTLRWIFGLPLLAVGLGGFVLGLASGTLLAVPAGLVALVGFWLIAPHRFQPGKVEGAELDEDVAWDMLDPADGRNAGNPALPGTPAWFAETTRRG